VRRAYYSDSIAAFLNRTESEVLGYLAAAAPANIEATQRDAWSFQIRLLISSLRQFSGRGAIYFEYSLPRLGRRIDTVLLIDHVVFVRLCGLYCHARLFTLSSKLVTVISRCPHVIKLLTTHST
jgi:hypothetical protein